MAVLSGINADFYISGTTTAFAVSEPMTKNADNKTFQITLDARRVLDPGVARVYEYTLNGTTWTNINPVTNPFTEDLVIGRMVLATAQPTWQAVRVKTGSYLPMAHALNGTEWSVSIERATIKTTTFGSKWRTQGMGEISASGKLARFWADTSFGDLIKNGTEFVARFYVDVDNKRYLVGRAILKAAATKDSADALASEDLDFDIQGALYPQP